VTAGSHTAAKAAAHRCWDCGNHGFRRREEPGSWMFCGHLHAYIQARGDLAPGERGENCPHWTPIGDRAANYYPTHNGQFKEGVSYGG